MDPKTPTRTDLFDVLTVHNPSSTPFEVWYNSELHAVIQPHKAVQLVKLIAGDAYTGSIKHLIDRMCRLQGKPKNEPAVRSAWYEKIVISNKSNRLPVAPTLEEQARAMNQQLATQPIDVELPAAPSLPTAPSIPAPASAPSDQAYIDMGYKFHPVTGLPLTASKATGISPDQIDVSQVEIQTAAPVVPSALPGVMPAAPLPHPDPTTNEILTGLRKEGEDDERVLKVDAEPEAPVAPEAPKRTATPTKEQLIEYARDVLMMNTDDVKTREALEAQDVPSLMKSLKYDVYA